VNLGAAGVTAATESPQKRRYVPDAADIEAVKRIKMSEVELTDRNTVLRGSKQSVSLFILVRSD
jgi:parafibromin